MLISKSVGIELKSPKMLVSRDCANDWRDQLLKTWAFMRKHYVVCSSLECGTHVHISKVPDERGNESRLEFLKRLGQCIIHFEPALEALMPVSRRGNLYAMSNWIDNHQFAGRKMSRTECINAIDKCKTESHVIVLMSSPPMGRYWAWNYQAYHKFGTVEFRKGSSSQNGEQALAWADLVLLFGRAASLTRPDSLNGIPANVGALREFLGVENLQSLRPLLSGKRCSDSVQPTPILSISLDQEVQKHKLRCDATRQKELAARHQESRSR
jgi:hypothetical protein